MTRVPSAIDLQITRVRDYLAHEDRNSHTPGRQRIMQAVLSVAVSKGMGAVSMRSIAKEVDVKAATLYSHFEGGKDELIGETLRWNYNEFLTTVLDFLPDAGTPDDRLRGLVRGHMAFELDSSWHNLFEAALSADRVGGFLSDATRTLVASRRRLYLNLVSAVVDEFRSDRFVMARAWGIISYLNDSAFLVGHVPGGTAREDIEEFAFHCCRGIANSAPA